MKTNNGKKLPTLFPLLSLLAAMLLAGCTRNSGATPSDYAAHAAKAYYDQLLHGNYEAFVDGHLQPSRLPESYREQLVANAKMFIGQQQAERQGIKRVTIANAKADTARHTASVYLNFHYGDGSTEEVLVPMVLRRGVWHLR